MASRTTQNSLSIISQHQVRQDVPPSNHKVVMHSYSSRKYQNLIEQFASATTELRIKILRELILFLNSPNEIIYSLLHSSILALLFNNLDPAINEEIRVLSSDCLNLICFEKAGRDAVYNNGMIQTVLDLAFDGCLRIRLNILEIILNYVKEPHYRLELIKLKILNSVFKGLESETDEKSLVLLTQIFSNLLSELSIADQSLELNSIKLIMKVIQVVSPQKTLAAIECLTFMSYSEKALDQLITTKTYKTMLQFFKANDQQWCLVKMLFLLFTSLSIKTEAKQFFVEQSMIQYVFNYLKQSEPDKELILNSILFLTSMAEHPDGRLELSGTIEQLKPFCSELFYSEICVYAKDLIEEIQWKP